MMDDHGGGNHDRTDGVHDHGVGNHDRMDDHGVGSDHRDNNLNVGGVQNVGGAESDSINASRGLGGTISGPREASSNALLPSQNKEVIKEIR